MSDEDVARTTESLPEAVRPHNAHDDAGNGESTNEARSTAARGDRGKTPTRKRRPMNEIRGGDE